MRNLVKVRKGLPTYAYVKSNPEKSKIDASLND